MATSGTYAFAVNKDQILRMAMMTLGKLDEVEAPTPSEAADMTMFLNMLIKQWVGNQDEGGGLKCWNRRTGYLFLSGTKGGLTPFQIGPSGTGWTNSFVTTSATVAATIGANSLTIASVVGINILDNIGIEVAPETLYWTTITNIVGNVITIAGTLPGAMNISAVVYTYTIAAQLPITLETALLRDNTGGDTPLRFMTREEYMLQSSKASPTNISDPLLIYWEPQLTYSNIFTNVYGCSDMSKYIVLGYLETAQDMTNPGDSPYFPQDWYLPLALGVAKLSAPMFRTTWTPLMESNYTTALKIAHNKDPDEVERRFFQPGED